MIRAQQARHRLTGPRGGPLASQGAGAGCCIMCVPRAGRCLCRSSRRVHRRWLVNTPRPGQHPPPGPPANRPTGPPGTPVLRARLGVAETDRGFPDLCYSAMSCSATLGLSCAPWRRGPPPPTRPNRHPPPTRPPGPPRLLLPQVQEQVPGKKKLSGAAVQHCAYACCCCVVGWREAGLRHAELPGLEEAWTRAGGGSTTEAPG